MKKILLVAIVLVCMGASQNASAQKGDLKDIDHLSFYGVDFTYAKVYGADETAHQFLDAFIRINDLFESEPKTYNVSKAFGIRSDELFNRQVKQDVDNIPRNELFTDDNKYAVTDADIDQVVAKIEKEGDSQYGAVIVAGLLNKTANHGTFTFVVFDQDTKEIIFQQEATGKARGFGLRNFWAGALRGAMKNVR
ncbi:putative secreted protein [Proteiniphilum saccharofermentans]|uniref:Putative secreted protein n=1 Tax=Proteiniphilum saccharofermentans TaxID=1642647 RepID=A0A1R3T668_9BACT|nr:hypothetical protein [Proteiniphilum saccharofermentans]SCD21589.1 putative secreted protein [Proteiniphilum saccharofermentans]